MVDICDVKIKTRPNNVDPPCDFTGEDSFSELQKAYENLIEDLNELENVYDDQSSYHAKTVKVYHENEEQLDENYENYYKKNEII